MAKRILVTGGAGYFGSLLTGKLLDRGLAVRVFDLNAYDDPPGGLEVHRGDVRDIDAIGRACRDVDVVFHNVAQVPLAKDKALFWSVNRDGTRNLLEAARRNGVRKVVYTSSSAVFGVPRQNPVREETTPSPMEDYGRAKLEGERLCMQYAGQGLEIAIIRPRTIMGHGRLGIFQILFEWILEGANVPVLNGGHNLYQFVHADDLATACILASERAGTSVYNIGCDRFGTMREVLENLCRHAGTGSRVKSLPMWLVEPAMKAAAAVGLSPLGPYHSLMFGRSLYFDTTRARQELGWHSRYSNDEMFIESFEWYKKHRGQVLAGESGRSHHRSAVKQGVLKLIRYVL